MFHYMPAAAPTVPNHAPRTKRLPSYIEEPGSRPTRSAPCTARQHVLECGHTVHTRQGINCGTNCAARVPFEAWPLRCRPCREEDDGIVLDALEALGCVLYSWDVTAPEPLPVAQGETREFYTLASGPDGASGNVKVYEGTNVAMDWMDVDKERTLREWLYPLVLDGSMSHCGIGLQGVTESGHVATATDRLLSADIHLPLISLQHPQIHSSTAQHLPDVLPGYKFYFLYHLEGVVKPAYVLLLQTSVSGRLRRIGLGYSILPRPQPSQNLSESQARDQLHPLVEQIECVVAERLECARLAAVYAERRRRKAAGETKPYYRVVGEARQRTNGDDDYSPGLGPGPVHRSKNDAVEHSHLRSRETEAAGSVKAKSGLRRWSMNLVRSCRAKLCRVSDYDSPSCSGHGLQSAAGSEMLDNARASDVLQPQLQSQLQSHANMIMSCRADLCYSSGYSNGYSNSSPHATMHEATNSHGPSSPPINLDISTHRLRRKARLALRNKSSTYFPRIDEHTTWEGTGRLDWSAWSSARGGDGVGLELDG